MNAMQATRLAYRSEQRDAILRAHIRAVNKRIRKAAAMGITIVNFSFDFEQFPLGLKGQNELMRIFQKKGYIVSVYERDLDTGLTIIFRDNLRPANIDGCNNIVSGADLHEGDLVKYDGIICDVAVVDPPSIYLFSLDDHQRYAVPIENDFYLVAVYPFPHLK